MLRKNRKDPLTIQQRIYQAAIENNITDLQEIIDEGISLNIRAGCWSAIMRLAADNQEQAVTLLINKFRCCRSQAITGFAYGEHENTLSLFKTKYAWSENLINKYAAFGYALNSNILKANLYMDTRPETLIRGYAATRQIDKVIELCGNPINFDLFNIALIGFGQSGINPLNTNMLRYQLGVSREEHLRYYKQFTKSITYGLALGGFDVLARNNTFYQRDSLLAFKGYCNGGNLKMLFNFVDSQPHLIEILSPRIIKNSFEFNFPLENSQDVLRIITFCRHEKLKLLIISTHIKYYRSAITYNEELQLLEDLMRQSYVNYQTMKMYVIVNVKIMTNLSKLGRDKLTWIIECGSLVRNHILPKDVYFLIVKMLIGLSFKQSMLIYRALHQHLFNEICKAINHPFNRIQNTAYRFFYNKNEPTIDEQLAIVEEHHQKRFLEY